MVNSHSSLFEYVSRCLSLIDLMNLGTPYHHFEDQVLLIELIV